VKARALLKGKTLPELDLLNRPT